MGGVEVPPGSGLSRSVADNETRSVEAVVVAMTPEFHQAKVRDSVGHMYALTRQTDGFTFETLQEGQRVRCTVTCRLPRVLRIELIA